MGGLFDFSYSKGESLEEAKPRPNHIDAVDIVDLEINPVDDETLARIKKYLKDLREGRSVSSMLIYIGDNWDNLTNFIL